MRTPLRLATVLAFLFTSGNLLAQESDDYQAIVKTLNYYLEGGTNNDFETLKRAFSEDAGMKYLREGEYVNVNALEFFGSRIKPGPRQERRTRIVRIDLSGNAAAARLEIEYPTFTFIDYMNLLKIDGQWKVVNKIFYRKDHE